MDKNIEQRIFLKFCIANGISCYRKLTVKWYKAIKSGGDVMENGWICLALIDNIQESCSHYTEWTTNRMRFKLYAMERELIKDAIQKIKSIQHMKTLYSKTHSYQIADRIFFIRRKFARMMRVYTIAIDNIQKEYYHFLLKCMEEINYLSMDIDHLVEMVTEFEKHHASDLIDIGGLTVPADILDPSNIGKDLAKILGGGGTGGSGGAGLPSLPSSTDIPGFPQGLPTTHAINPVNPHGEGGRPPVVRAPPGAGSMWGGRSRAVGRPMAYGVFRTPRDPFY